MLRLKLVRVLVVHHSLNTVGGAERLCLNVMEALKGAGHKVTLASLEKPDWGRVRRAFGRSVEVESRYVLPFRLRMFGIYQRPLTGLVAQALRGGADMIVNTHGDLMPCHADLTYMHYPVLALGLERGSKYTSSPFWRLYFTPYELSQRVMLRMFLKRGVIATNSTFSAEAVRKFLGVPAVVVHPPVDVETFHVERSKDPRLVLTVGRYSPEKRFDLVPRVARRCRGLRFIVAGSLTPRGEVYLRRLREEARRLGAGNVEFLADVPLGELRSLYGEASAYLHLMVNEHFGISVVEAMASGCIPVVHRSGGTWRDILAEGRYGLGYRSLDECVEALEKVYKGEFEELREEVRERAWDFSEDRFKSRFIHVFDRVASLKEG